MPKGGQGLGYHPNAAWHWDPGKSFLSPDFSLPVSDTGTEAAARRPDELGLAGERVPHLEAGPSQVTLSILKGSSRNSSFR